MGESGRRVCLCSLLLLASVLSAPGASGVEPSGESVVASLPFETSPPSRVVIDIAPEGNRPFPIMLDTGAQHSVMTPRAARRLGVTVRAARGNRPYTRATRLGRDLQFHIDTKSSDTGARSFEHALLGTNFLRHYVVEIDYGKRRVRFLDPKKFEVPESPMSPDERVVDALETDSGLAVPFGLRGRKLYALIDTGSPAGLLLSSKNVEKAGIEVDELPQGPTMRNVMGPMDTRILDREPMRFSGFRIPAVQMYVADGWFTQSARTGSIVGYPVLRDFVMRLDYERRRVWLRKSPNATW